MQIPITVNGVIIHVIDIVNVTDKTPACLRIPGADTYHVKTLGMNTPIVLHHDRSEGALALAGRALRALVEGQDACKKG